MEAITSLARSSPVLKQHVPRLQALVSEVSVMTKGILINGRKYSQGNQVPLCTPMYPWIPTCTFMYPHIAQVEFMLPIPRNAPEAFDPVHLGTINMFYTFHVDPDTTLTFVEVSILPKIESPPDTNLHITERIDRQEARLAGFERVPSGLTKIIFIDSITRKIKLVPHWTDETKMCAIKIWDAR
jgi:hypothetical protein